MRNVFSKFKPLPVSCGDDYSFFFDFIEKEVPGKRRPFHSICTLMRKLKVQFFIREELESNSEVTEELAAIGKRAGTNVGGSAIRFTFFRRRPQNDSWEDLENVDILGYAVLLRLDSPVFLNGSSGDNPHKNTLHGYILEAAVVPPCVVLPSGAVEGVTNYYVHSCREFKTTVGIVGAAKNFEFTGTFFCQQNGFTNACAHAALRMAINSWPRHTGAKLTFECINKVLKIDHSSFKNQPNRGLSSMEMAQVIRQLGYDPDLANFQASPDMSYDEYIYPLIESGFPVILRLSKAPTEDSEEGPFGHVVAIIGHTLNSDRWAEARHGYGTVPNSHYISAAAWADHFIVNDDNFGMYVALPTDAIKNIIVPKYNPNLFASVSIGILPTVSHPPERRIVGYAAERAASILLPKLLQDPAVTAPTRWFKVLRDGDHAPVLRTVCREKGQYIESLKQISDGGGNPISDDDINLVESLLPESVWVTEVMTPALYTGNKHKLGEIVCKTTASENDFKTGKAPVFAWLPGVRWHGVLLEEGPHSWPINSHVPLLRGIKIEKCRLEW